MNNATCRRLRIPVAPDYSTILLLLIPGHRTLSPPLLFIGGSTRARPTTYAFFKCQRWARERRVPARCHGVDTTAAPGSVGQSRHENGRLAIIVDQDMPRAPCLVSSQASCIAWTRSTGTAFPSELYPPPTLGDRTPRVCSPRSLKRHPRRPSQSLGDTISRLPLRPRGSSPFSFLGQPAAPSPSPRDSPKRQPQLTTAWRFTAASLHPVPGNLPILAGRNSLPTQKTPAEPTLRNQISI